MAVPSFMKYLLEDSHGGFFHSSIHSFILPWAGFRGCNCDTAAVSVPSIVGEAGEWTSRDTKCVSAVMRLARQMAVEPREGTFGKAGGGEGSKFQAEGAGSSEVERDSTAPWGLKNRREKAGGRGRGGVMRGRGGHSPEAMLPAAPCTPPPYLSYPHVLDGPRGQSPPHLGVQVKVKLKDTGARTK